MRIQMRSMTLPGAAGSCGNPERVRHFVIRASYDFHYSIRDANFRLSFRRGNLFSAPVRSRVGRSCRSRRAIYLVAFHSAARHCAVALIAQRYFSSSVLQNVTSSASAFECARLAIVAARFPPEADPSRPELRR